MSVKSEPVIGKWYQNDAGASLEIIALDSDEGVVEIQYFDGAVEELDFDTWYESGMKPAAAPEDWSGPFDDLVRDDMGDTEKTYQPDDWANPVETIETEVEVDFSE